MVLEKLVLLAVALAAMPSHASARELLSLPPGSRAVQLAMGLAHTCALFADGNVKCWGSNDFGQLGTGTPGSLGARPGEVGREQRPVSLGMRAISIAAGDSHNCAILEDRSVKCWGQNAAGQLGLGDNVNRGLANDMGENLPPVDLGPGARALQLSAGIAHTCALLEGGAVKCWGSNAVGQLGKNPAEIAQMGATPNTMGAANTPINVGTSPVRAILAGGRRACVVKTDGWINCWGDDAQGSIVISGLKEYQGKPTGAFGRRRNLPANRFISVASVDEGKVCVFTRNGELLCLGDLTLLAGNSNNAAAYFLKETPAELACGTQHCCQRSEAGQVRCWGTNRGGNLGRVVATPVLTPNDATTDIELGFESVRQIAVSKGAQDLAFSCAIGDVGEVKCWGTNRLGELGLGDTIARGATSGSMGADLPELPF